MMLTPAHSWSAVTMTRVSGLRSGEPLRHRDRAVELDGVVDPALGVHVVGLLVDGGAFDHQHEALAVPSTGPRAPSPSSRRAWAGRGSRSRRPRSRRPAGRSACRRPRSCWSRRRGRAAWSSLAGVAVEVGLVGGVVEAGGLEVRDQVAGLVERPRRRPPGGARSVRLRSRCLRRAPSPASRREEPLAAPAHQDLEAGEPAVVEELVHDAGARGAALGVEAKAAGVASKTSEVVTMPSRACP